jgi:hypothetical protein
MQVITKQGALNWRHQILKSGCDLKWSIIQPKSVRSANGSELRVLPDQSIHASGACPKQDDYIIDTDIPFRTITGLHLEVLPDDSLPCRGPGRAGDGNFLLTDFQVQSERSWRRIAADHSQQVGDYKIESVNQPGGRGWGVIPEAGPNPLCDHRVRDTALHSEWKTHCQIGFSLPN